MLPQVNPLILDEIIVLISTAFIQSFSVDEQDVIGNFFSSLGAMVLFNSSYLGYVQSVNDDKEEDQKDYYDLLEESIDKIKEEIEKLKKERD